MSVKQNIIKGWVTTIVGIVTMIISLVLVWQRVFDFVWEGVTGLLAGVIIMFIRRTFLETAVIKAIESWGKRGQSDYFGGYTNVDQDQPYEPKKPE